MKRTIAAIFLAAVTLTAFAACGGNPAEADPSIVTATNPPASVEVFLTVTLPDGTQTRQGLIRSGPSAQATLGEVLDEYGLAERDNTGMIVKVAGVQASWEKDHAYWAFYINGEMAMHGVDEEILADGNEYEFRYTKG
ncbi:MAG: DUF4430 domain-containing protein [Oscillospiraceae bacterium]|nr:DUF4430 domain-containing protein [Oscillospiraceae bacterium]